MTPARLPHSDTPGSQLGCQLPRAYRRLLRPSSALDAKASTMRPSQLAKQTNTTHTKKTMRLMHSKQTLSDKHCKEPQNIHYKDTRIHYTKTKQPTHTHQPHPQGAPAKARPRALRTAHAADPSEPQQHVTPRNPGTQQPTGMPTRRATTTTPPPTGDSTARHRCSTRQQPDPHPHTGQKGHNVAP